ncbi:MAG: PKD domain-containing protein [Bacteroidales bacterium]|nr:PKD domain-containing protein [Bacteroidales bacterium]
MKTKNLIIPIVFVVLFFVYNSCKKNSAPVADFKADSTSFVGDTLLLDATASSDADNDSLRYYWDVIEKPENSGDALQIFNPGVPLFIPVKGGNYTVQLYVSDGNANSDTLSVSIKVMDYYGKWALVSRQPWPANAIETKDTVIYMEDGTVEWYQYYKVGNAFKFLSKSKGKQESPAGLMEWTEMVFSTPPAIANIKITKSNDLYDIIKTSNQTAKDTYIKGIYYLSDNGKTLTIAVDANKDGDYEDFNNDPADMVTVMERVK